MTVIRDAGGLVGGGLRQFMALTAVSLLWVSVMAARAGADRLERVRVSKDQRGFDWAHLSFLQVSVS
jgi:hypothetical protein